MSTLQRSEVRLSPSTSHIVLYLTLSVNTLSTFLSPSMMQVLAMASPTGSGLMEVERNRGLSGYE